MDDLIEPHEALPYCDCHACALVERNKLMAAIELAFGLLWMVETDNGKAHKAREVLKDTFRARWGDPHEAIRRGINAAIVAGFEADHPPGADWWCGKLETPNAAISGPAEGGPAG